MPAHRWVIVGSAGMLGTDVAEVLTGAGERVVALDRGRLDVTDASACLAALTEADVVVNCSAYTAVDDAESHEAQAFAVNAVGAANVARGARAAGARLVHVSTDYVFGAETGPEPIAEQTPVSPRSAYGRTKAAGEWAAMAVAPDCLVVRTAWLYGRHGGCFPKTILRLLGERDTVSVVDDQHGQPTWTRDVADLVVRLVEAAVPAGIYHATSSGAASWYAFARAVARVAGLDEQRVRPTTTEAFPRPAPRPAHSVLGHEALDRAGVFPIGEWHSRLVTAAVEVLGAPGSR